MGRIGWRWAQRAHFWAAPVLSRLSAASGGVKTGLTPATGDLDTLLQEADFVLRDPAANGRTRHLFGATQFARMKCPLFY